MGVFAGSAKATQQYTLYCWAFIFAECQNSVFFDGVGQPRFGYDLLALEKGNYREIVLN